MSSVVARSSLHSLASRSIHGYAELHPAIYRRSRHAASDSGQSTGSGRGISLRGLFHARRAGTRPGKASWRVRSAREDPASEPLGRDCQARHRRYQSAVGGASRSRYAQGRRDGGRCRDRRQRHDGPGRADELRDRRRHVCHLLGQQNAETVRPQRQRPQSVRGQSRSLQAERTQVHSGRRCSVVVGPRLRRRLGPVAVSGSAR